MSQPIIVVGLDLDSEESVKKLRETLAKAGKKSGEDAGDKFGQGFSSGITSGLRSVTAKLIGIGGAIATALGSRAAINAAVRQEEAINSLNASLLRIGQFSQESSRGLQEFAGQIQSVSKIGDEAAIEALAFAQSLGASVEQSKAVVTAAVDLSAALNIDLNSAVRNIGKTLGGFAGELGEVIPELKNLTTEQLQSGIAIDIIAKKYDGFARNQLRGFGGATAQLSNTFGDLGEAIGKIVTENPAVIAIVQATTQALSNLKTVVDQNRDSIIEFINNAVSRAIPVIREAWNQVKNLFDLFVNVVAPIGAATIATLKFSEAVTVVGAAIKTAGLGSFAARLGPIAAAATAAAGAIGLIVKGVENDQKINSQIDRLQAKLGKFQDELKRRSEEGEASFFDTLLDPLKGAKTADIESGISKIKGELNGLFAQLNEQAIQQEEQGGVFDKIFAPFSQENIEALIERIKVPFQVANQEIGNTANTVSAGAKAINDSLNAGLKNGLVQTFAFLGKALAGAGGGFKEFLGIVLSALGDLAISIGTTVIGGALAIEALRDSLAGSPAAAIALGGALVAVGAALKTFGASLGGSTTSPVGGFDQASPGGASATDTSFDFAGQEERQAQQNVQLIVQGDILDSEDTGRRLVKLLNDNFETEASSLTSVRFA